MFEEYSNRAGGELVPGLGETISQPTPTIVPSGPPPHEDRADEWETCRFQLEADGRRSPIGIMDLENGEVTTLTEELGPASHRGWSPDGAYLPDDDSGGETGRRSG